MNTQEFIDILQANNFYGIDASLEISLFEYNLVYNQKTEQALFLRVDDGVQCYYAMDITDDDITEAFSNHERGILEYCGMDKETWLSQDIVHKINDIEMYCGAFVESRWHVYWDYEDILDDLMLSCDTFEETVNIKTLFEFRRDIGNESYTLLIFTDNGKPSLFVAKGEKNERIAFPGDWFAPDDDKTLTDTVTIDLNYRDNIKLIFDLLSEGEVNA